VLGEQLETWLATARTVRSFAAKPVDRTALETLIWAATRAPSPANTQPWRFVIVDDYDTKLAIQQIVVPQLERRRESRDATASAAGETMLVAVDNMIRNVSQVPAIVFCCGDAAQFVNAGGRRFLWSAVHPAIGYLLVAARASGLGSALTMLHLLDEQPIRELVGIPAAYDICGTVLVGYPDQEFTTVRRRPHASTIYWNHWEEQS
jgi:nitroreductase